MKSKRCPKKLKKQLKRLMKAELLKHNPNLKVAKTLDGMANQMLWQSFEIERKRVIKDFRYTSIGAIA